MFLFLLSLLSINNSYSEEPLTIVVEEHRDYEIYVAPIKIINNSKYDITKSNIAYENYLSFLSSYKTLSKFKDNGIKKPISMSERNVMVYGIDTIGYIWDDCNYQRNYKLCSYENGNYYIEGILTVTDNEISFVVSMYDRDFQVVSRGSSSSKIKVNYIPNIKSNPAETNTTCINSICSSPQQQNPNVDVTYEKEVIPPSLFLNDIRQSSLSMWVGVLFE